MIIHTYHCDPKHNIDNKCIFYKLAAVRFIHTDASVRDTLQSESKYE